MDQHGPRLFMAAHSSTTGHTTLSPAFPPAVIRYFYTGTTAYRRLRRGLKAYRLQKVLVQDGRGRKIFPFRIFSTSRQCSADLYPPIIPSLYFPRKATALRELTTFMWR